MKKILSLTFGSLMALCLMLVGATTKTYAAEVNETEQPKQNFIYTTASELGLPSSLDAQLDLSSYGTASDISVNGFRYNIASASSVTVEITSDAANMETIYLTTDIGTWDIYDAIYNSLDFKGFTSAKNLVLDTTVNLSAMYKIFSNTNVENVFVLNDNDMPLIPSSEKVKNIVFCYGYGWLEGNKWDNYNVNLSSLPNAKIVTIDSNKYGIRASIDSYRENRNYTEGEHYPLYVIEDDDFPYAESMLTKGAYLEFGGAIYATTRTNLDMFPKYRLAYIDEMVTKIIIDSSELDGGVFSEYTQKIDTVYVKEGTDASVAKSLRATNLVAPMPVTFTYSDYANFDNVYFYNTETRDTLLIGPDSISADVTATTNFYIEEDASFLNQSSNGTITAKVTKVEVMPEAVVEIEVDAKSIATSDPKTKISTLLEELNKEDEKVETPDQGTNDGNTDETDKGNDSTDDTNKPSVEDEIKDAIDDFKENLKENKALQAVTAIASILLSFVVGYLIYLFVRKVIRWVK